MVIIKQCTSEVLCELKYIKEIVNEIKEHIKTQNGKVNEHNSFMDRQGVLNWVHGVFTLSCLSLLIKLIFF